MIDPHRVAARFRAKQGAIVWKKTPGGLQKVGDSGIYAKSEDGRFLIFARRWRSGEPGNRGYTYFYSVVDYATPSEGKRYTNVPVPGSANNESVNLDKVRMAAEKWAEEHPVGEKTAAGKMSPVLLKFFDRMYARNKAKYDETAASEAEWWADELLDKKPNASDEEMLEEALKKGFSGISLENTIEEFPAFVAPFMRDVFARVSEWWDAEADLDAKQNIVLTAHMEGEWFEVPSDDPMNRVEVPGHLYTRDIEAALKSAGANSIHVDWRLAPPEDEMFKQSHDAVKYDLRAVWNVNWKQVNTRYGREAFIEEFKKTLASMRAKRAEDT